jgi:hypothetical protein
MKRVFALALTLLALSAVQSRSCFAQTQGSTVLVSVALGGQISLGYQFPSTEAGIGVELPVGNHLEFIAYGGFSPDQKFHAEWPAKSVIGDGRAILWLNHRFGLIGGARYVQDWIKPQTKFQLYPLAGISIRDHFFELPGRMDVVYEFPTGDLNRVEGVRLYQSFRIASRLRFGLDIGGWEFRGYPLDGTRHAATSGALRLEVELGHHGGIY